MTKNELPAGWKRREDGLFEYKMFPFEVKEMERQRRTTFILATLNIVQALFIIILVLSHFCNQK